MQHIRVRINDLTQEGHGIGYNNNQQQYYVLGSFPGDVLDVIPYKTVDGKHYAQIHSLVQPSPKRSYTPQEFPFFQFHAPWLYLSHEYECYYKKNIINQIMKPYTKSSLDIELHSVNKEKILQYRNKSAFSFMDDSQGTIYYAMYPRGVASTEKQVFNDNALEHPHISKAAQDFLLFFRKHHAYPHLKYIVFRYSYLEDTVVAHILTTTTSRKSLSFKKRDLKDFYEHHDYLKGVLVSSSPKNIRSSLTTNDFYHYGDITIIEQIDGKNYSYHPSQFFQVFPEEFSEILRDIKKRITSIPNSHTYELLDLYAGIGIIGIHVSHLVSRVVAVEQSPLAQHYACRNAEENKVRNYTFFESDANGSLHSLQSQQILILDPPRSGIDTKLVQNILSTLPEHILYLSCNPRTQARDIAQLLPYYKYQWSRAYNLFPNTHHIEHLIHLQRKDNK